MPPRRLVLIHKHAPGDTLVLTGLVRDIALTHPGEFEVDVLVNGDSLFRNNPHITPLKNLNATRERIEYIKICYGKGIREQAHETVHFLGYFHRNFEQQCKARVPLTLPYPDLHLSDEERTQPLIDGRYWIILSGGKNDFPVKVWSTAGFQAVVDKLAGAGLGVVQIGSTAAGHWNPTLTGVLNLVGRTNLRDMMRLIHHADGVICGVTCAMHMAAALQRPCVVIAGGREAWWWEAYVRENKGLGGPACAAKLAVPHRFLHTIGLLDCCQYAGCWKDQVVKIGSSHSVCYKPITLPGQVLPQCMDMITPETVFEAAMSYYTDKSLPPITAPKTLPAPVLTHLDPPPERPMLNLLDAGYLPPSPTPAVILTSPPGITPQAPQIPAPLTVPVHKTIKVPQLAAGAALEGRAQQQARSDVFDPSKYRNDPRLFDNVDIGGKFTICVLLYGPEQFSELHQRCLNAIIDSVPPDRMDMRIGSNELNSRSITLVDRLMAQGIVTKHYMHRENAKKYPVMREMLHDPLHPITTKWVLWFDDDSIADKTNAWLGYLCQSIIQHHRKDNAHMFGAVFTSALQGGQREWYQARPWWRGKPWRLQNGQESPNGNKIVFCTGGFWALTNEAIQRCGIPDSDLQHNGGDILIGEMLHQHGFGIKSFNAQKQFINTSSVPRRGLSEPHPGTPSWKLLGP